MSPEPILFFIISSSCCCLSSFHWLWDKDKKYSFCFSPLIVSYPFSGCFHKSLSGSITLWSSPTSNTLAASPLLICFSHDPFPGQRKLEKNKHRLWRGYLRFLTLLTSCLDFGGQHVIFHAWDQKTGDPLQFCMGFSFLIFPPKLQEHMLSHVDSSTRHSLPNPLCFWLRDSSKCSLNVFPLAKPGEASARLFSAMADGHMDVWFLWSFFVVCLTQRFKISDVLFQSVVHPYGSWFNTRRFFLSDMGIAVCWQNTTEMYLINGVPFWHS